MMMGTMCRKYLVGAGLCLGAWLPAGSAQYARTLDYLIDRPGTRGPSGHIGGTYTGQFAPLSMTRGDVSLLGQNQYEFRGRRRAAHLESRLHDRMPRGNDLTQRRSFGYGRGLGAGDLGLRGDLAEPGPASFYGGMASYGRSLAGLASPMRLDLPPPSIPIGYVPGITAHEYGPRPTTTPFQNLFGLLPAPSEPEGEVLQTAAERLNARTDRTAELAEHEGLELFKQATVEARDPRTGRFVNCIDCADKLASAVQRLRMVRVLDVQASFPVLLLAHASLEQEQATVAVHYLVEAFARGPSLFDAAPGELDRCFGDAADEGSSSAILAAQLRRYRRIGELNPDAPDALVLQAYCAWRLGEHDRARAAMDQLDALALGSETKVSPELLEFSTALRKALP